MHRRPAQSYYVPTEALLLPSAALPSAFLKYSTSMLARQRATLSSFAQARIGVKHLLSVAVKSAPRRSNSSVVSTRPRGAARCSGLSCYVKYRVTQKVSDLGWVDLVLRVPSADGPLPLATFCPSRMREHAKSESTQPRSETCLVTL